MDQSEIIRDLKRARALLGLVTIGQVMESGRASIEAAGLSPYCVNEGQAQKSDRIPLWWLDHLITEFEEMKTITIDNVDIDLHLISRD